MKNIISDIKYNRGTKQFNDILCRVVPHFYSTLIEYAYGDVLFARITYGMNTVFIFYNNIELCDLKCGLDYKEIATLMYERIDMKNREIIIVLDNKNKQVEFKYGH